MVTPIETLVPKVTAGISSVRPTSECQVLHTDPISTRPHFHISTDPISRSVKFCTPTPFPRPHFHPFPNRPHFHFPVPIGHDSLTTLHPSRPAPPSRRARLHCSRERRARPAA